MLAQASPLCQIDSPDALQKSMCFLWFIFMMKNLRLTLKKVNVCFATDVLRHDIKWASSDLLDRGGVQGERGDLDLQFLIFQLRVCVSFAKNKITFVSLLEKLRNLFQEASTQRRRVMSCFKHLPDYLKRSFPADLMKLFSISFSTFGVSWRRCLILNKFAFSK